MANNQVIIPISEKLFNDLWKALPPQHRFCTPGPDETLVLEDCLTHERLVFQVKPEITDGNK